MFKDKIKIPFQTPRRFVQFSPTLA